MRDHTREAATERRLSNRKPCNADVYLVWPGQRARRHHASNVSNSGIFVELPTGGISPGSSSPNTISPNITHGARLELVLAVRRGNVHKLYRLPAVVARVTHGGAGLYVDRQRRRA